MCFLRATKEVNDPQASALRPELPISSPVAPFFFGDDVVHGSGKGVRLFCGGGLRDVSMTVSFGKWAQGVP